MGNDLEAVLSARSIGRRVSARRCRDFAVGYAFYVAAIPQFSLRLTQITKG
jgi:hypothetical protein